MPDLNDKIASLSPAKRALLDRLRAQRLADAAPALRRSSGGSDNTIQMSFAQERLWLLHQLDTSGFLYNVPRAVRIHGRLNVPWLEWSLNEILRRHEVLRATFSTAGDVPFQHIAPGATLSLAISDIAVYDSNEIDAEIQRRAIEEIRRPFDLKTGPLIRGLVLRLSEDDHVLVLTLHHIVSDGWTSGILFDELGSLYQSASTNAPVPLPELPLQYSDYAAWQRKYMQGDRLTRELAYWSSRMEGAPSSIELPTDQARPEVASYRGRRVGIAIPKTLSDEAKAFSQRHNMTLFPVLLGALKVLLFHWTGQSDLVVGTVSANRNLTEIEKLVGCFMNFLPLRDMVTGHASASEIITQVNQTVVEAYAHQDLPFEKLVEALNPQRSLNINPIYNVALLMQSFPEIAFRSDSLEARFLNLDTEVSFLDLRFLATERPTGIWLECEYATDLFNAETIEELLLAYQSILEQLLARPQMNVAGFAIPGKLASQAAAAAKARKKWTVAVAATFTAEPIEECLAFWMQRLGIASNIEFAPYNQVFQQLVDPSSLLASNTNGVNIVLLRMEDWHSFDADRDSEKKGEHNLQQLIANIKVAASRTASPYVLCVCQPSRKSVARPGALEQFLRMGRRLADALRETAGVHVITSTEIQELYPVTNYDDPYLENLGHIPYTSAYFTAVGTMLARRIYGLRRTLRKVIVLDCDNTLWRGVCAEDGAQGVVVDPPRRALQEFVIAQQKAGMLLCMCSKNTPESVDEVFEQNAEMLLKRHDFSAARVNWRPKSENLAQLSQELGLALDSFVFIDDNPLECAEVRAACPEVLTLTLPESDDDIPHFLAHVWALDHWKVTEADTQRAASYRQSVEREQLRKGSTSLEDFLAGLELHIEIRKARADDIPRVSQLTHRTNQFNLTTIRRSEREVQLLSESGAECLVVEVRDRFGDYGLVGVIIYSQSEDAIKLDSMLLSCRVLGRRVEHRMIARLGQIAQERKLDRVEIRVSPTQKNRPAQDFMASIAKNFAETKGKDLLYRLPLSVAVGAESVWNTEATTSHAVLESPTSSASKSDSGIIASIASDLSDPATIAIAIERHKALQPRASTGYLAPRNPTEEILAGIWSQVLRVEKVGIRDNFFSLGGHSLAATRVVARIRQALGVELPLQAIFESRTVEQLGLLVRAESEATSSEQVNPPVREIHGERIPLSFAQQRLWFVDQLEPGNPMYNIPQVIRLRGNLDVRALQESINEIVRRHEVLRTVFQVIDNQPAQIILPELKISLHSLDVSHVEEETRLEQATQLLKTEALKPFNLAAGPLLSVLLVSLGPQEHMLLVNTHHIVSDRWSMGVFFDELAKLYPAFQRHENSPLPELPIQYADHSTWQRRYLQGEVLARQVAYWKQNLSGAPPVLELPTDRPRGATQNYLGRSQTHLLPNTLLRELTTLSQAEGVTLFMTLLAAFQTLLARYSRQEDIVVGSPIANRNFAEVEPLIGLFVNTLALRGDLSGDPSFRDLLQRVKSTAMGAYQHQDIPFEKLVEELQPDRSLSHHPIFQVLFALQNVPMQALELPDLILERVPLYPDTSMFDMSWFAIEVPEGLLLRVEYNTDLFDNSTIGRMQGHFEALLHEVAKHPSRQISKFALLAEQERSKVLIEFNRTAAEYRQDLCIHDFFEAQANRTPDAIALVCDERRLSYRELNEHANRLANYLVQSGAGPEVLVGLCAERGVEMMVGILGILKAGGAYVPLDPAYPKDRLAWILEDAKAPILLTQQSLLAGLPAHSAKTICIDSQWPTIALEDPVAPRSSVKPANLAYVLFTSGSTGRPKGVALEHRSAATFLHWAQEVFTPEELAGVLFSTSICFDLSVFEMFVPLSVGGKVITAQNALYLPTLAARDEVTLINTVPSAIAELVRAKGVPESVKIVNLAGEALPDALVEEIYSSTAVEKIYNLYGPTEDTTYSTYTLVPRGVPVTIGRPLANTQAYILDNHREPLPIGVPGELYLAGEGLARGYFGRPDLTSERFVANPFSSAPHARMYRTGDLCRWLPDGNIQYLGRMDHQVKLRGFRIELGEIESALARHPDVHQCVVVVREDEPGLKRLVAYIACRGTHRAQAEELLAHLKQSVPEFMLPSAFVFLDALPLTPNGKVNRNALPIPEYRHEADESFVAPRTSQETKIAEIWAEVLHVQPIGANHDFFALGGHSLLAAQVVSRLRQAFQVELPLRAIFEAPKLSALALKIEAAQRDDRATTIPPLGPASRTARLPLSFAQQRMWFLDQLEPNNPLYNIPCSLRATFPVRTKELEDALNLLAERHETLRTSFPVVEGEPIQQIAAEVRIPLAVVDLSDLPGAERHVQARRLIEQETQRPFDLTRAPLLRATILRLAPEEQIVLLNIHHIISDRWSMGVLFEELSSLYDSCCAGVSPSLPLLPVQYADFAVWQREYLQGDVYRAQLAYWKEHLQGAPAVLRLPTDRPRPPMETFRGDAVRLRLSKGLTDRLQNLSREQGTTIFMTLLAAFNVLLSRYSGEEDIVLGLPMASRGHAETEHLIGLFANTLPMRTRLEGNPSFQQVLLRCKEASLGAFAHEHMPFERLVEELQPERSLSHNPLVQVFFILQNARIDCLRLNGVALEHLEAETRTSKGDLFFMLSETDGGLAARMEYNTDLYDEATIARMLEHYRALLEAAVANPALPVSELPLLTRDERQQLLEDWNATDFEYPRDLCLHELFEQQVQRAPEATAVMHDGQSLSYAELNRRANQLAHFLKQRGVGPGQRVGLFVERSLAMMVGLLGIQKSGAAYVPLDPSYPAERLRLTLDDAQVPVLLTQQSLLPSMPEHQGEVVCLDTDWEKIAAHSSANLKSGATPEDLVYVIFTSGSTGRPKGVQVPHRAVVNLLTFMASELRMGPDDVFPALASFAFDMCIPELYLALVSGGRVIIGDKHLAANGEALAELVRSSGATILHATPTTWNLLLEAGFTGKGMKRVIGAEALPRELCTRLLQADASLYNFYGPTETTVWSAFHHFRHPEEPIVVGRPLANTQIYILDAHGQPVPIGVPGEIHIAGDGVTCGYLNRPELTAEKFVRDPFSANPNAKMYRTGDLGRFLPDGRIEFEGRIDNQVKIRGYRIELGEIETVLGQHPAVQECVVIAREDVPGDKRLVGYVVPAAGQSPSVTELRSWVKERVPEYMTPVAFVTLERFPLSPNGKVDRKHLPAPDYVRPDLGRAYLQARTPAEEVIAGIWAEVLKLNQVGIEDDFFELGGHSLLATQVVSRIRRAFQVELPLRSMFEASTVAGLAERTEALQRQKQGLHIPPMTRVARDKPMPLSFAQQRLWFLDQLEPNNPLYNVAHIVRLRGALNAGVLEKTLNEIVRRHETLRTHFESIDDYPVQVIAPALTLPLVVTDLSSVAESERENEARRLAMEEVKTPFNLAAGPLLRASLMKLAEDDHVLVVNTHHIISDRWSLGVLSQEMAALYEAYLVDKPSPLPDLPIQYADYAVWQRRYLSGDTLNRQLAYWKQQLEGAPEVLELPSDHPRRPVGNFWGGVIRRPLKETLVRELRALSRGQGVTFYMTLLASFQFLLAERSGQNDIVVGTDFAGRTQLETEKLIGFFVNLLPIRAQFMGDPPFSEVLHQVRETSLGAFAHQELPFDKLVEELRPERSLTHNPLVQVLFVMQNTPQAVLEFGGLKLGPLGVSSTSRFDLVLFINDPDGAPSTTWMYNPNLFDASTVERWAMVYEEALGRIASNSEVKLSDLRNAMVEADRNARAGEHLNFERASLDRLKKIARNRG